MSAHPLLSPRDGTNLLPTRPALPGDIPSLRLVRRVDGFRELPAEEAMAAPAWLSILSPTDRVTARRWLREAGGEAALARIARASVWSARARGRPGKDETYRPLVLRAAVRYMTTQRGDYGDAAGVVAREAADPTVTMRAVRRQVLDRLKRADAAFWDEAEQVTTKRGLTVLRNPNDPVDEDLRVTRSRRLQREHDAKVARLNQAPAATRQTWLNIDAMLAAYNDMPVSEAMRFLGDAADAWAAERGAKSDARKK